MADHDEAVRGNDLVSEYASFHDAVFGAAARIGSLATEGVEGVEAAGKLAGKGFIGVNVVLGVAAQGVYGGIKEAVVGTAAYFAGESAIVALGGAAVEGGIEGGLIGGPVGAIAGAAVGLGVAVVGDRVFDHYFKAEPQVDLPKAESHQSAS